MSAHVLALMCLCVGLAEPSPHPFASLLRSTGLTAALNFARPVRGELSSRFGWRDGRQHEGIDISAPRGAEIHAAEAGRVTLSGRLRGYGRVVIVEHAGHYSTVYAHNRRNWVEEGALVEKGQVIAEVGASGNAKGPHVHFEIRHRHRPHDPLEFLHSLKE